MNRLADLIQRDAAHLAALESLDNGKPYQIALAVDVPGTIETLRFIIILNYLKKYNMKLIKIK